MKYKFTNSNLNSDYLTVNNTIMYTSSVGIRVLIFLNMLVELWSGLVW